jgi:hypothetical protein
VPVDRITAQCLLPKSWSNEASICVDVTVTYSARPATRLHLLA